MKKNHKFNYFFSAIVIALLFSFNVSVSTTFAQTAAAANPHAGTADNYTGLVKCSGVAVNQGEVPCDFNAFIGTVSYLINWGFGLSVPIAAVLFVYAGFLYVTGIEKNIDKAKGIFKNVAIGFIIMLVAFTVVHTLVGWLVNPNIGAESLLQVNK